MAKFTLYAYKEVFLWQPGKQIGTEPEWWQEAHTEHCLRNLRATTSGLSHSNYSNPKEMGKRNGTSKVSEVEVAERWKCSAGGQRRGLEAAPASGLKRMVSGATQQDKECRRRSTLSSCRTEVLWPLRAEERGSGGIQVHLES